MERTTDDGVWESPDGGRTWLLTAPSRAWRAAQAAVPDGNPARPDERIAQLEQQLQAVKVTADSAKATADEVARRPR